MYIYRWTFNIKKIITYTFIMYLHDITTLKRVNVFKIKLLKFANYAYSL